MGFRNVVVTDCLEMEAVAARDGGVPRAATDALRAGADVVMICHQFDRHVNSIRAAHEAVQNGAIDLEELRESGRRIATMKDRFAGRWEDVVDTPFNSAEWTKVKAANAQLSRDAYRDAIAIIQNPRSVIPLTKAGPFMIFTPQMESLNLAVDDTESILRTPDGKLRNTAGPSYTALAELVRRRVSGDYTHVIYGLRSLSTRQVWTS